MDRQDHFWSQAAAAYEREFIDPFRSDVKNPVLDVIKKLPARRRGVVADLGCGIGPLLPLLSRRFREVLAVDFAPGMLQRARERCQGLTNIAFLQHSFLDLGPLEHRLDVAVAINSLVLPRIPDLEQSLANIRQCVKPGGYFLGILPAMDSIHYYTMLLLDRALARGLPLDAARKNAAQFGDHAYFDFAFGQFHFQGLEQHFWQPFEIRQRFRKAGFHLKRLKKMPLSWKQFAWHRELQEHPAPWDWFFLAE